MYCIVLYFALSLSGHSDRIFVNLFIMNVDNVKSQMRKGILEYCILLILDKKPSYAPDIINALKEAKIIVVEGTLYPLLTRLKNSEVLSYQWEESTQGPPRKYYSLTEQGREILGELEKAWNEIDATIAAIKNENA
jgi:PadR family transcriptional regulator, regulatory protein PadR